MDHVRASPCSSLSGVGALGLEEGRSPGLHPMPEMAREVWQLADSQSPKTTVTSFSQSQTGKCIPDPSLLLFASVCNLTSPGRFSAGMNLGEESTHLRVSLWALKEAMRVNHLVECPAPTPASSGNTGFITVFVLFCKTTEMNLPSEIHCDLPQDHTKAHQGRTQSRAQRYQKHLSSPQTE